MSLFLCLKIFFLIYTFYLIHKPSKCITIAHVVGQDVKFFVSKTPPWFDLGLNSTPYKIRKAKAIHG